LRPKPALRERFGHTMRPDAVRRRCPLNTRH
jgi:hypothetical protein